MPALIRSASLTHYAELARACGLDPLRMVAEAGLPSDCLREPDLKIPADAVRELLERSAQRSGLETFGLRLAETRRLSNLGPLALLVREEATLRGALDALARYGALHNQALFLHIEEVGTQVVLRQEMVVGRGVPMRQSTELALGVFFRLLRVLLGPGWTPRRVCFTHTAPADRSVHERLFGPRVEFSHDFNGIVCTAGDLDALNPGADPVITLRATGARNEPAIWRNRHRARGTSTGVRAAAVRTMLRRVGGPASWRRSAHRASSACSRRRDLFRYR